MTTGIANASAFDRTRTQLLRVKVGEKRSIAANFASLLGAATIVSAEWLMDTACVVGISNAAIAGKSVSLMVTAVEDGEVGLKCEATTSAGDVFVQEFVIQVPCGVYYGDDTGLTGPVRLIAQ